MAAAPTITTVPSLVSGRVGVRYSATITASGSPAPAFSCTGLPDGLGISSTGVISGVPTTAGTETVTITATNTEGTDEFVTTITVDPAILATIADLASYLQQGFPDGDTAAQDAVDSATAVVQTWCRRPLLAIDDDTHTTTGGSRILLPHTPVRSVSSVLVDSVETIDNWELRADGAIVWVGSTAAPTSSAAVVITYDSGFLDTDFKVQVARAVAIRLAARLYQNPLDRGTFSGPEGLQYSPSAGVSARLLTGDEQMMLASLRDVEGFA